MTNISNLLEIMAVLRDPQRGCPWDIEQDFRSIAPYTIEEAYEVAEAIDRSDLDALRDELGDLLLQVVFHAQMAAEQQAFSFADVVQAISEKLLRRHPHVFSDTVIASAAEQREAWESHKAREQGRGPGGSSRVLTGVSASLPALARAAKLGRRARSVGFDWPDASGVVDKVREEIDELAVARQSMDAEAVTEEIGDLLFSVANLARHLDVDPEEALRRANRKFEHRFAALEDRVRADGRAWREIDAGELDALWRQVKGRQY
jgi:MazG family protein